MSTKVHSESAPSAPVARGEAKADSGAEMADRGIDDPDDGTFDHDREYDVDLRDDQLQMSRPVLANVIGCLCLPVTLLCGCFTVQPNEEVLELSYGSYVYKYVAPGLHWSSCWGRELKRVSTRQMTVDLPTVVCLDKTGNPLRVSAIIVFRFDNTQRAALGVQDAQKYVRNMATASLRKVVSEFPYETDDESPSLKTHQSMVSHKLRAVARRQLASAGAFVSQFQLNELSYSPEIAAAMLRRQAAAALVSARRTLVEGCTQIALDAVNILEDSDIVMTDSEKVAIVRNVLTVTCSDSSAQPVLSVD